jgi:hypothetical protein
VTVAK